MVFPTDSLNQESNAIVCPVCNKTSRVGELICASCGTALTSGGKTRKLDAASIPNAVKATAQVRGQLAVAQKRKLQFQIGGQEVALPVAETITVGRAIPALETGNPDVDLTPFGAEIKGVSRMHLRIQWRGILPYITDLRSTNGTSLNGHKLIPNVERIIHDGDELWLGNLDMIIRLE